MDDAAAGPELHQLRDDFVHEFPPVVRLENQWGTKDTKDVN
jgi:hypothetical protein